MRRGHAPRKHILLQEVTGRFSVEKGQRRNKIHENGIGLISNLVACLQKRLHPSLQHHLDGCSNSRSGMGKTWGSKFRENGTARQVNLLRAAL